MNALQARLRGRAGSLQLDVEFDTGGGPLVLAGRNGSGKTSVLRMILGLLAPDSGRVRIAERVLFDSDTGIDVALEERGLGYVPQHYGLFPHLRVVDNVAFAIGSQRRRVPQADLRERAAQALHELDLAPLAARSVVSLSSGEKQRVALARALAARPAALLLDEPLAALDVGARREVRAFLAAYLARLEIPTLLVTHDPADALAIGHRIAVLDAGRIVQIGSYEQLAMQPASAFVAEFSLADAGARSRSVESNQHARNTLASDRSTVAEPIARDVAASAVLACKQPHRVRPTHRSSAIAIDTDQPPRGLRYARRPPTMAWPCNRDRGRTASNARALLALCWFGGLASVVPSCGDESDALSVSANAHYLLVSQAGSTTLAVIDPKPGRVLQRIQVGSLPHRMLRDRSGRNVYAVLVGSQAVAEIDTRTLTLRRTLLTAEVPERRADGTTIEPHQSQHAFEHTSCFDCHHAGGAMPAVVGERPVGIALSADESLLYVSHIRGALLSVIDLASGRLLRSEHLPPTAAAVEAADLVRVGDNLIVALRPTQPSTDPGVVRFLDSDTLEPRAEFATGSDPASLLALPERGCALVSNFESDSVTELCLGADPRKFTVTPGPLGSVSLDDAGAVLTLDYYSNAASLVDLDTAQVTQLELSRAGRTYVNPTHAALDPSARIAYVVSSGTDGHLLALDLRTRELSTAVPIDGLSFDVVTIPR